MDLVLLGQTVSCRPPTGEVPKDLGCYNDYVLIEAASLIRAYHDATSNLLAAPSAQTAKLEVVCHNDLSPCNFVFQKGRPTAIIDFDAAAPGPRLHDLGYAAWTWLDLESSANRVASRKVRRFSVRSEDFGARLVDLLDCLVDLRHLRPECRAQIVEMIGSGAADLRKRGAT